MRNNELLIGLQSLIILADRRNSFLGSRLQVVIENPPTADLASHSPRLPITTLIEADGSLTTRAPPLIKHFG
jgi:hypothetical protein